MHLDTCQAGAEKIIRALADTLAYPNCDMVAAIHGIVAIDFQLADLPATFENRPMTFTVKSAHHRFVGIQSRNLPIT